MMGMRYDTGYAQHFDDAFPKVAFNLENRILSETYRNTRRCVADAKESTAIRETRKRPGIPAGGSAPRGRGQGASRLVERPRWRRCRECLSRGLRPVGLCCAHVGPRRVWRDRVRARAN